MFDEGKIKFTNAAQSRLIAIYGLDAEGFLMAEYRGDANSQPSMLSLMKFANCAQLILEDSDHKFIRMK